jgi:hypothetical protein
LKIIGLIGGMSWESTVPYYRQINEVIKERLGGLHSAKVVLYSVDFHEIERLQHSGEWEAAGVLLADSARALESAGGPLVRHDEHSRPHGSRVGACGGEPRFRGNVGMTTQRFTPRFRGNA